MSDNRDDLDELKALACDRLEELAECVMGVPNRGSRRGRDWRWGSKGGQSLVVRGPRRGLFFAFDGDTGGSVLDMIMFQHGRSLRDAIAWLRSWLGIGESDPIAATEEMRAARALRRAEAEAQEAAEQAAKLAQLRDTWRRADRQFADTPGDRYLRKTRHIPKPAGGWPESIRYDRRRNALVFAVTDTVGELVALQLIYLTPDGEKLGEAELQRRGLPNAKMSHGPRSAGVVRFPGDPAGPLLLAEGGETGLSAWVATGHETWVALGAIPDIQPPAGRPIIVCADDDRRFSQSAKKLRTTVAAWRRAGLDVVVVTPWERRRYDKSDFNDVIQAGGINTARARINWALLTAPQPSARLPVQEARERIGRVIGDFFVRLRAFYATGQEGDAPMLALQADTGASKSSIALEHGHQAAGEMRTLHAVPTVALADELAKKQRKLGRRAEVRRGREQPDPETGGKEKMCRNLPAVRDALEAGANVEEAACRKKMRDGTVRSCPFHDWCGYYRQDAEQRDADVVFLPHDLLTLPRPKALAGNAVLIGDENLLRPFLVGHEDNIFIPFDALATNDEIVNHRDRFAAQAQTAELRGLRHKLEALRSITPGPVTREMLLVAGITDANCRSAYGLEWKRKIDPDMWPGMPAENRRLAKRPAEDNRFVRRITRLWKSLERVLADGGPIASGWVEIAIEETEVGPVKGLRLKGCKPLGKGWEKTPTLLIDATLQPDLLRHIWPHLEVAEPVSLAVPPGVRVMQVDDRAYSLSMLQQLDSENADEAQQQTHGRRHPVNPEQEQKWREEGKRRRRCLRDLHAWLVRTALSYGTEQVLIVAQLRVKDALLKLGNFPPNVVWGHHNGVAGRDDWKDARAVIVIGRTQPPPEAVERMAEALTGAAVIRLKETQPQGWYPRVDAVRQMRDGRLLPAEADRHPDSIAEAFRWRACEGELIQIIGRPRWADRNKENTLDIFLLTDVPVPFLVDELISAADLRPSPHDLMVAAGGVAFENPTDAAAVYEELWGNREAAKSAFRQRGRLGSPPYKCLCLGGRPQPPLVRAVYQAAGTGRRPAVAWFAPSICPDPAAFISSKLGALVRWEVEPAEPAPRLPAQEAPARPAVPIVLPAAALTPSAPAGVPSESVELAMLRLLARSTDTLSERLAKYGRAQTDPVLPQPPPGRPRGVPSELTPLPVQPPSPVSRAPVLGDVPAVGAALAGGARVGVQARATLCMPPLALSFASLGSLGLYPPRSPRLWPQAIGPP